MRRFRAYLRTSFKEREFEKKIQQCKAKELKSYVLTFMEEDLSLPKALIDKRNMQKMLSMLLIPSQNKKLVHREMRCSVVTSIFAENNQRLRFEFF